MASETPNLSFQEVDTLTMPQFKKMLILLFPVPYPPFYFKSILANNASAYLVLKGKNVIGCISWRKIPKEEEGIELLNFGVMCRHRRYVNSKEKYPFPAKLTTNFYNSAAYFPQHFVFQNEILLFHIPTNQKRVSHCIAINQSIIHTLIYLSTLLEPRMAVLPPLKLMVFRCF